MKLHRLEDLVIPDDLHYTAEHEWVKVVSDGVRVGITDHAQEALGDIVFVTLPAPGTQVVGGQTLGEVESTKSVSDIYAPISGEVVSRNEALDARPELVNADPYGEGWMIEIRPSEPGDVDGLLDSAAYGALVTSA
ncbi:MAG TPA: glycine cleavage system protein GcvH [Acidothermaceae bacterium]|nr:glycine cleavage system protein GcvH [Acidothermaceae bacterium]